MIPYFPVDSELGHAVLGLTATILFDIVLGTFTHCKTDFGKLVGTLKLFSIYPPSDIYFISLGRGA